MIKDVFFLHLVHSTWKIFLVPFTFISTEWTAKVRLKKFSDPNSTKACSEFGWLEI